MPNDPNSSRDPNGERAGDPNFNWRGLILLAIAFTLIGGAFFFKSGVGANVAEISYPRLMELINEGKIVKDKDKPLNLLVEVGRNTQVLTGFYEKDGQPTPFRSTIYLNFSRDLEQKLLEKGYYASPKEESTLLASLLASFLPIAIFLLVLYFLFRQQIRMAGKGALNFGKSKAKMMARDKNKITFKDVAGVEEAKEEVSELVEFLKDPKKFQKLGGRIPKGVLMIGSPGTGKTLLARAIAGEADVPFFSISGSDFVEMFVGVGASRVRDMFEQGRKSAPCLIFIDEIDAVGRHRGHGVGGGHDEREQTLNALLVEMDGFDAQEGIIIIAATNRPDVLDPALLRPGRFDRQVTVPLPDVRGREEILRVHAKKVKIADDVDLGVIARGTPGYSGAELANVINEAALLAARKSQKAINQPDLEEARDKVRWGKERRSLAQSNKEKENTAYHEAGHALLNVLLPHTDPLHKVTIIPRGPALGVTMSLPLEDKYTARKNELLARLIVIMGGRVAEEIIFGDVTSGASGDIKQATALARKMVCEWGMSKELGMVGYTDNEDYVFLGRDLGRSRGYSEATAQEIDREVKQFIDNAYARATELLTHHRDKLEIIAKALLEFETLTGAQIQDISDTGTMSDPPKPKAPTSSEPQQPQVKLPEKLRPLPPELPPGLAGAPA
jgi:cell division protease FtsH